MPKRCLYIKVTKDKFELPVFIADTAKELAAYEGVTENTIYSCISHYEHGAVKTCRYRRVRIDE